MRRPLAAFACLAFVCAGAAAAQPQAPNQSWAEPQIRFVVAHGLMAKRVAGFSPDAPLTRGALNQVVAALGRTATASPWPPSTTDPHQVTIAQLDSRLVTGLGLSTAPAKLRAGRAGRRPHRPEPFRHRGGRAADRPALQPPGRPRTASSSSPARRRRAPRRRSRSRRRCSSPRTAAAGARRVASTFDAPGADRLADPGARHRREADRLPVRVGGHEREAAVADGHAGAGRVRLLRLRLARLQAAGLRRTAASSPRR